MARPFLLQNITLSLIEMSSLFRRASVGVHGAVNVQIIRNYNSGVGRGVTPPKASRTTTSSGSHEKQGVNNAGAKLDPDKIKGPGGLTMTQIGKLVQDSRARDLEQMTKKQQGSKK